MMRRLPLLLLCLALPALADDVGTEPPERARVEPLLRALERVPDRVLLDTAAQMDAHDVLMTIALDDRAAVQARVQALTALAAYPDAAVTDVLASQITANAGFAVGTQVLYLRAAAVSLGQQAGAPAIAAIAPLLDHPVTDVRADAARALALTNSPDALPALRDRLTREEDPMVVGALRRAIRALSE